MSISAIVNAQYGEVRELVQHTPKRDKQSERKPGKIIMQPCQPSAVILSHGSATNSGQPGFSLMSQSGGMPVDYNSSYNGAPQSSLPPSQHTFERIQFQKATANNGKRRAQQQYYNLVVELFAEISPVGSSESQWIKIARRLSHPMVVRGRSPGHYKDGRRDSSTSMGPDGGNGGSGDGSGGAVLPPGLGQTTRSHLGLMPYDSSQRGGPSYGRNDYHHMGAADHSPLSESPHISSSASSNFDIGILNDSMNPIDSLKNTSSMDSYQDPSFGLVDSKKEGPYQHHLPPFEYDPISKDSEDSGTSFPGAYNSMVSMLPHEHGESSHFLKQPTRMASQGYHPGPGGYDSIYSTSSRSASSSYYRIPNSQGLCA
ncbi:hypothetical protein ARAM_000037 [Aspergillus rambellii]|uniref:NDT80 domain-containing protein n=3 Tax=Aspergillus subgen. Nidulantes TaxID=2720870 RepID=A0A0F8V5Q3_9EURO|nr:hypothetical protein AOCH_003987 [Aspergillus ochraceoroseus]KKK27093.1 hypothetical protein ARAM_000037 [Aspergillus rambellii]